MNRAAFFRSIAAWFAGLVAVVTGARAEPEPEVYDIVLSPQFGGPPPEQYIGDMGDWTEQSIRAYAHSENEEVRSHQPWRQGDKYCHVHVHIGPHRFTIRVDRDGPCYEPRSDEGFYRVEVARARDAWYNGHEREVLGRFRIEAKPHRQAKGPDHV